MKQLNLFLSSLVAFAMCGSYSENYLPAAEITNYLKHLEQPYENYTGHEGIIKAEEVNIECSLTPKQAIESAAVVGLGSAAIFCIVKFLGGISGAAAVGSAAAYLGVPCLVIGTVYFAVKHNFMNSTNETLERSLCAELLG